MKYYFALIGFLIALDQATKIWAMSALNFYETRPFIPNLIDLTLLENKGISFSFLSDLPDWFRLPLLIGVSLIASIWLVYHFVKEYETSNLFFRYSFSMIISGAVSNLVDRSFDGAVTDFLHFRWYDTSFFVNNLADIFISIGVVLFLLSQSKKDQTNEKTDSAA